MDILWLYTDIARVDDGGLDDDALVADELLDVRASYGEVNRYASICCPRELSLTNSTRRASG